MLLPRKTHLAPSLLGSLFTVAAVAQDIPYAGTETAGPIGNASAVLNGKVNPHRLKTAAWFEWGHTIGYGNLTSMDDAGDGNEPVSVSKTLTNLVAGTVYHCRIVASNQLGVARGANTLFWSIPLEPNKPNPLTNELHTPFRDPGAGARPLSMAASPSSCLVVKADGTLAQWGSGTSVATNANATNLIAVAAHWSFMGLRADGTVLSWGPGPTLPADATNAVAIAGGSAHALALRADGTLVAWGNNSYGQINVPPQATNVISVSAGMNHSLALNADGSVSAWGSNGSGQTNVPPDLTNVVAIAAGSSHSLAVNKDGTVVGWGSNSYGQTNVPSHATNVVAVAAGEFHSLALRKDGSVVAWGTTNYQTVPAEATNVAAISANRSVNAALTSDGRVLTWGDLYSFYGNTNIPGDLNALKVSVATNAAVNVDALGEYPVTYVVTNSIGAVSTATRTVVVVPERPLVTIALPTGIVNTDATLIGSVNPRGVATAAWFEWGTRTKAQSSPIQTGDGTNSVSLNTDISGLAPGLHYRCRLVASNAFWTVQSEEQSFWVPAIIYPGTNPQTNQCHTPFDGSVVANAAPLAISAKDEVNYVLRADRTAFGWGPSGLGNRALSLMPGDLTNLSAVIVGGDLQNYDNFGVALTRDGTVRAWGRNDVGQTDVPDSATNVVQISAGDGHTLALRRDGTVVAWGYNNGGQTTVPAAATNVIAVAAGAYHSVALRADGTLVPWGGIPATASNLTMIAAGHSHDLALRSDGTVIGWGDNYYGQSTIPPTATNVVALAAGYYFSLALRADGSVIAWGDGSFGKTTVPVSATNVVAIAAAEHHALALRADGKLISWGFSDGRTDIPEAVSNLMLPVRIDGLVDTNTPGVYTLTYSATNELAAIGTAVRTVVVADTLAPNITLLGANPAVIPVSAAFADPGCTAFDLCGGDLTGSIVIAGTVDPTTPGKYSLAYSVTDPGGLTASTNRTVFVLQPPLISGATRLADGSFEFRLNTISGAPLRVLACTNISGPPSDWIEVGTMSEGPPGLFHFTDSGTTNQTSRFYRVACP